ncbi:MAG: hypothetical protein PVJ09_05210 [Candidatus Woesebacteria bacterium]|jgi:quercetin dioxygenase-like cupin family protein
MIKKFFCSELDRHNLSKHKVNILQEDDAFDYRQMVVNKPWGYEYLMYQNDYVAIWILNLKKNHGTSMHCHPQKKTSLVVLSGKVQGSTLQEWFELSQLDGAMYDSGVFHTTKALTDDVFVMEIESPVNKKDLVRLKDNYGRENDGYEGKNKMSRNLKSFEYVFFDDQAIKKQEKKVIRNLSLSIKNCQSNCLKKEVTNTDESKLYCLLEEKIIDEKLKSAFGVGSFFHSNHLVNFDNIRLFNNASLLSLEIIL